MKRVWLAPTIVCILAIFLTSGTAAASYPGRNGRIAFDSLDGYIWSVKPDGTNSLRLALGEDPNYSPDGKRIAFVRGNTDLWLMSANGSNKVQLTSHVNREYHPTWSADGRFLYFLSNRGGRDDIFRVRSSPPYGKAQPILRASSLDVPTECEGQPEVEFTWITDITMSPLGDYLALSLHRQILGHSGPCLHNPIESWVRANVDGSGAVEFANQMMCLNWGPGGTSLAGLHVNDWNWFGGATIRTFRSDGSGQKVAYTQPPERDARTGCPAWSPNGGKHLIFSREEYVPNSDPEPDNVLVVSGVFRTLSNGTGAVVQITSRRAGNVDWQPILT